MKCLNMNLGEVLFFLANFLTIYSSDDVQDIISSTQSTASVSERVVESTLDKDCFQTLKIIHDSNLTDYSVECKAANLKTDVITEESVLQQACFIVKNILSFMCETQLNVTADLFKINNASAQPVCPFNFSHLRLSDFKSINNTLVKELTNETHCLKVCEDLYSLKTQCLLLSQLNNYLKLNVTSLQTDKPLTKPEHKTTIQKTEKNTVKSQEEGRESEKGAVKEIIRKEKNETAPNKLNVTSKNSSKSVHEQKVENTSKVTNKQFSGNQHVLQVEEDLKSGSESPNEELEGALDGISDSSPNEPYSNLVEKISAPSLKGKEIYSGEGFFQAEDSHFFFYFIMMCSIVVIGYLAFHNKNKILAYALEGTSGRRSRRRPNPARYRKLETNLEEAISSSATNSAASSVVY